MALAVWTNGVSTGSGTAAANAAGQLVTGQQGSLNPIVPAANSLYLVTGILYGASGTPSTATLSGLGATWTEVINETFTTTASDDIRVIVWRAMQASYTSTLLTMSFTAGTSDLCRLTATNVTGAHLDGLDDNGASALRGGVVNFAEGTDTLTSGSPKLATFSSFLDPDNRTFFHVIDGLTTTTPDGATITDPLQGHGSSLLGAGQPGYSQAGGINMINDTSISWYWGAGASEERAWLYVQAEVLEAGTTIPPDPTVYTSVDALLFSSDPEVPSGGDDDEPANFESQRRVLPAKFKVINRFPFEYLRNKEMNDATENQLFLHENKVDAYIRHRENDGDRSLGTPPVLRANLNIYSEYRAITTSNRDNGEEYFEKTITLPDDMFSGAVVPIVFGKVGYFGKAVKKVNEVIHSPATPDFKLRVQSLGNEFDDNMDYFANIMVVGPENLETNDDQYLTVDWGTRSQKIQITSELLNQQAENSRYLYHNRPAAYHRNVSREGVPDDGIVYLNNRVIMYANYVEFKPDSDTFRRSETTDDDAPKSFTHEFFLPNQMFNPLIKPVVIHNVGAKIAAEPGTEIRKISSVLKRTGTQSFVIQIIEHAPEDNFSSADVYFCSYIVIGEEVVPGGTVLQV